MNLDSSIKYAVNCARFYKRKFQSKFYPGKTLVECPICGWKGVEFLDFDCGYGNIYKNAECPVCLSHPRHRLVYLYLQQCLKAKKSYRLLHFAPEDTLVRFLRKQKNLVYLSVDIDPTLAMQCEDIENLSFKDETFDIILCLCVLEHVNDDHKALRELYRVLKPGAICVIDVPIDDSKKITLEDSSIRNPEDRSKKYWQADHVRLYGRDFGERLKKTGFRVAHLYTSSFVRNKLISYFGLPNYPLYICVK